MGNYVFAPGPLIEELRVDAERESHHDFGRNILPSMVKSGKVFAYNFGLNRIRVVSRCFSRCFSKLFRIAVLPQFEIFPRNLFILKILWSASPGQI